MQVSFIVTAYNVAAYIRQCLDSLVPVLEPGDQLIIVDDGSSDDTVQVIRTALADLPWPPEVDLCPVFLGTNTFGGVGIAANIGLSRATREAVFFVDGDDWLVPDGLRRARRAFADHDHDILLANYRVFDEVAQADADPSDQHLWDTLPVGLTGAEARQRALAMNSVPWRKFYRRALLTKHKIRFPEGDFFYEDNPFHWEVCLQADRIGFCDTRLAHHRMNRPGQTMQGQGAGLGVMFQHYETILGHVARLQPDLEPLADQWLATNMAWQLERIEPGAIFGYAMAAEAALCGRRHKRWRKFCSAGLAGQEAGYCIGALLAGGAQGLVQAWLPLYTTRRIARIEAVLVEQKADLAEVRGRVARIEHLAVEARDSALGAWNQAEFSAMNRSEDDGQ